MPLPILLIDAETGIVLESNRRTEWLLGLSPGEIVGMHFMQLFPGKQAERCKKLLDSKDGAPVSERTVVCRKSGEKVPVTLHAKAVGLQGRACVLAILHEETEKAQGPQKRTSLRGRDRKTSLSQTISTTVAPREDVIRLVASGLTNREIAGDCSSAPKRSAPTGPGSWKSRGSQDGRHRPVRRSSRSHRLMP